MTKSELKTKLSKSIEFLESELSQIRTGRANPSLLEDLSVEAYDSKMALRELSSVTLVDAHIISVSPWDKGLLPVISKAIRESDLKLNPVELGANLRVPVPPLTEERRKELARLVSQKVEDCKQSLRSIRQEYMKDVDRDFEDKKISEDDKFIRREDGEETTKEHSDKAEEIGKNKIAEVMTV